jgi:hypothetical protein
MAGKIRTLQCIGFAGRVWQDYFMIDIYECLPENVFNLNIVNIMFKIRYVLSGVYEEILCV